MTYHINGIAPKSVASPRAEGFARGSDRVAAGTCNICQIPIFINIIGRDRRRWLCDTFAIAKGNAQFSWKQLRPTIWFQQHGRILPYITGVIYGISQRQRLTHGSQSDARIFKNNGYITFAARQKLNSIQFLPRKYESGSRSLCDF